MGESNEYLQTSWILDQIRSFIAGLHDCLGASFAAWFWNGYLIGKRICGIRIVKKDGSQVSLLTMFLRVIVAGLVYGITFGLGLIASLILIGVREDKRTLHDLIAGTYVTYASPGEEELYTDEQIRKSE